MTSASRRRVSSGAKPKSPATMALSVPWPRPVQAKLPCRPMSARTGCDPSSARATPPMRAAPAVWLLEGPIMTGPMISNTFMGKGSFNCGHSALCWP